MFSTIIKSIDTLVKIANTSNSVTLSLTVIGSLVIPISNGIVCGLRISNKVTNETFKRKHNKNKKQLKEELKAIKVFIKCIGKNYMMI